MLSINYKDPRPIYEQVRDALRQLILSGAIAPGEKLPSVRELAASLAINPNTIQRSYRELEALGLINTVPGKGAFAATDGAAAHRRHLHYGRRGGGGSGPLHPPPGGRPHPLQSRCGRPAVPAAAGGGSPLSNFTGKPVTESFH